jgi:hypothetical protein
MAELNENKRSSQEGDVLNLSTDNCKVDVLNISFERATKFSLVSFAANFLKHFTPSFSALSLNSVALCLIRYCCWRPIWLNISVVCEPQTAQHVFPLRKAKRNCLCHLWTWIFIVFFHTHLRHFASARESARAIRACLTPRFNAILGHNYSASTNKI